MNYTIKQRLETFIANCEYQGGFPNWDDTEKLTHILRLMELGYSIHDEFVFVSED